MSLLPLLGGAISRQKTEHWQPWIWEGRGGYRWVVRSFIPAVGLGLDWIILRKADMLLSYSMCNDHKVERAVDLSDASLRHHS